MVKQLIPYVDMVKYALQNFRELGREAEGEADISRWKSLADDAAVDFTLEGVESFKDIQFDHHLVVRWLQGFYFSKPVEKVQTSQDVSVG